MGIDSPLYAAGLCDYATIYSYNHEMVIFLLWKTYPAAAEAKVWISRDLPRKALFQATEEIKIIFAQLGVKYIFIACNRWPLRRIARALGAEVRQLPVGTMYEWSFDNGWQQGRTS